MLKLFYFTIMALTTLRLWSAVYLKVQHPALNFYRDDSKIEVDLLDFTDRRHPILSEIQSSQTYRDKYAKHLISVGEQIDKAGGDSLNVISRVESSYRARGVNVVSAADWMLRSSLRKDKNLWNRHDSKGYLWS